MNVEQFAERHHARARRDECGETIVPGKLWKLQPKLGRMYGHQVYDHSDGRVGVLLMFDSKAKWTNAKRKLLDAGFTLKQNGDTEGACLFDPENKAQAKLALKVAGVRIRRELSPERREALANQLAAARATKAA
jgi:hypothetical protein